MDQKVDFETTIRGGVHLAQRHDSAHKHVTGLAEYTDDIAEPVGTLHAYLGLADRAHAEIVSMDLEAVRAAPGVVGVLTGADMPGSNDISPVGKHDDPVLRRGQGRVPRPADLRGGRRDPRRGAAGGDSSRRSSTATCRTSPTSPRRSRRAIRSWSSR